MKRIGCYLIILLGGLLSCAMLFLGTLSLWVGTSHQERDGYWIPIVFGATLSILVLYSFFRLTRSLLRQTRHTDSIDV